MLYDTLSPNQSKMREQAETLKEFGAELRGILQTIPTANKGVLFSTFFQRLHSVADLCENAPAILEHRLFALYKARVPDMFSQYEIFVADKDTASIKARRNNMAHRCERYINDSGSGPFNSALAALEFDATTAQVKHQKTFLTELMVLGSGLISHSFGSFIHALFTATHFNALKKSNQLKIGLAQSAIALETLDRLFEHMEDLCLFIYLIPEDEDGENPVDEKTARGRYRLSTSIKTPTC